MDATRILRHVVHTRWALRRAFPAEALAAIGRAITAGERLHPGELRCVIEGELSWEALLAGQTVRERALEVFALAGVWDTAANNGVLLYVLFADHAVEIVADRGFSDRVSVAEWQAVCRRLEGRYRAGEFQAGTIEAIEAINSLIVREFPVPDGGPNQLPDQPRLL